MAEYRELKNPEDARDAYRRQQAQDTELSAVMAEANADAVRRLRDMEPGRPFEIGTEAQQSETAAADLRKRADALRKLSGMSDEEVAWGRILDSLRTQLATEEELHIRATDEADNHEAYNVNEADARFRASRQQARVDAYQAALDAIEKRMPKAGKTATRKASGSADT